MCIETGVATALAGAALRAGAQGCGKQFAQQQHHERSLALISHQARGWTVRGCEGALHHFVRRYKDRLI